MKRRTRHKNRSLLSTRKGKRTEWQVLLRRFRRSRVRRGSDGEEENIGTAIFESRGAHAREWRLYDSAFLRGRRRGRWCRSGCIEQKNKEVVVGDGSGERRVGTQQRRRARRGSWRKGGKRRKQKAIAYERQLAPLMARETKQKSEASSSNTIKPTVRTSLARVARKEEEKEDGRMKRKRNKEPRRKQWRASHRESCCRCCLPLSDAAVFALSLSSLPHLFFSFVVPLRFSHCFFSSFSSFSPLTSHRWQRCAATTSEWPGKRLALEN